MQAMNLNELGNILFDVGRWEEAGKTFEESRVMREAMISLADESEPYEVQLGYVNFNLGRVALASGRPDEAIGWFRQAATRFQREWDVRRDAPAGESREIRQSLCSAYREAARTLTQLGRPEEAVAYCRQGLELDEESHETGLRALHARVLAQMGRVKEAVEVAETVVVSPESSGQTLVDVAAAYTLAAAADSDEEDSVSLSSLAVETLKLARGKVDQLVNVTSDPDFQYLRDQGMLPD
jgi:tetratricopeptide (TPR) repeat protein